MIAKTNCKLSTFWAFQLSANWKVLLALRVKTSEWRLSNCRGNCVTPATSGSTYMECGSSRHSLSMLKPRYNPLLIYSCWFYTRVGHFGRESTHTVGAKQDSSSSLSLSVSALGSSPSSDSFFTSIKTNKHLFTHICFAALMSSFCKKTFCYFNPLP